MSKRKTTEEYIKELELKNPNLEVVGDYINNHTKILHKCKVHNMIYSAAPAQALKSCGCGQCRKEKMSTMFSKTYEQYIKEANEKNQNIEVLGVYAGANTQILHKCKICNYEWNTSPRNILHGSGCPVCSGNIIGPPPEYKNSIWASELKEYFSKYLTEEQMKQYMPNSTKNVNAICPDCGKYKSIRIHQLKDQGIGCICGDGYSYPNKFVYNVLCQLNLNIKPEYSPRWAKRKRYDEYLIDYNIIIENHGKQHYTQQGSLTHRPLEKELENDQTKYQLAKENGIKDYVILDCRKSSMQWIKQSILESALPILLNFDEQDIDWMAADTYATNSLIKQASDLYNNGINASNIAKQLSTTCTSVTRWLKKATEIGWCNYISSQHKC
jgi:hypothetical protein